MLAWNQDCCRCKWSRFQRHSAADDPADRGRKLCIPGAGRRWQAAQKAATRSLRLSEYEAQACLSRHSHFRNRGFWPRIDHTLTLVHCISEVDSNLIGGWSGRQKVTLFPAGEGILCDLNSLEQFLGSRKIA